MTVGMRRITALVVAPALALSLWAGAPAHATPALTGSLVASPLFLRADVYTWDGHVVRFIAYRNGPADDFSGVRVAAVRYVRAVDVPLVFVPEPDAADDAVLPAEALTVEPGPEPGSLKLHLRGELPNTGAWDVRIYSPPGGDRTATCPGTAIAPASGPLPHRDTVGTVGDETIYVKQCMTWGTDATGTFALPA
jgi:hypothetical protein